MKSKGLLFMGGIFSLIGSIILGIGLFNTYKFFEHQSLQKNGIETTGEIMRIYNSNLKVNNVTQKNIDIKFLGKTHTHKHVNPYFLRDNNKTVGSAILVKYNKNNPDKFSLNIPKDKFLLIFLNLFGMPFFLIGITTLITSIKRFKKYQYLLQYGMNSQGKILHIKKSLLKINNVRQLNLEIEFRGKKQIIKDFSPNFVEKLKLTEGGEVSLKYNSQNPDEFIIYDPQEAMKASPF